MYKVTIEEILGEVKRVVTVETEDVDLVKTILEVSKVKQVESDVDNLNIDPEWQELLNWYREKKAKEKSTDANEEAIRELAKLWEEVENESNKRRPTPPYTFPQPYVNPFSQPYDPYKPFTVTC